METKNNELYEAPSTTHVDAKFEGVICQSGALGSRNAYEATDENPFGA